MFPRLVEKLHVFSIARNPVDRVYSAFKFAKQGRTKEMGIKDPWKYRVPEFDSFDRFVMEWLPAQDLSCADFVFRPQHLFVCDQGRIAVDWLGRIEDMAGCESHLQSILGRRVSISHLNRVSKGATDLRKVLSPDVVRQIAVLYRDDFRLLGYDEP